MNLVFKNLAFKNLVVLWSIALTGCDSLAYFTQAATGQWEILQRRQPLDVLLAAQGTDPELKRKLALIQSARHWASTELLLDTGDSYTQYSALDRPYVVWNVIAAPEFSVVPSTWCFPIAGCVAYRGYFDESAARNFALELQKQGMETYVGGVEAYSTLGWFDDPVLSTFIKRSDAGLAGLIFHELAHRTLYVKNDSTFNESFATVVEQEGLRRWLDTQGQQTLWEQYLRYHRYQETFIALILDHRKQLETLYASALTEEQKRTSKQQLASMVLEKYHRIRDAEWNGYNGYDAWMHGSLNNAQLSTIATYHDYVPGFQKILQQCDQSMNCFLQRVKALADLDASARKAALFSM